MQHILIMLEAVRYYAIPNTACVCKHLSKLRYSCRASPVQFPLRPDHDRYDICYEKSSCIVILICVSLSPSLFSSLSLCVSVENGEHCDFTVLRNMLIRWAFFSTFISPNLIPWLQLDFLLFEEWNRLRSPVKPTSKRPLEADKFLFVPFIGPTCRI